MAAGLLIITSNEDDPGYPAQSGFPNVSSAHFCPLWCTTILQCAAASAAERAG
jgi:hypothetical protein